MTAIASGSVQGSNSFLQKSGWSYKIKLPSVTAESIFNSPARQKGTVSLADRPDHLLRGIRHRVTGDDCHAGFFQRLAAIFNIVAFKADDQRKLESGFLHRRHDASGNRVAVHDAAENIH